MRLWTLHPKYLDARGLVALWREGLLAQAVLRGQTRGYRHHPQLTRFRAGTRHVGAIATYLRAVHDESLLRGYRFAAAKVSRASYPDVIRTTRGQLEHEWEHLRRKVSRRDPRWRVTLDRVKRPEPHPLFRVVPGDIEPWERS